MKTMPFFLHTLGSEFLVNFRGPIRMVLICARFCSIRTTTEEFGSL